MLRELRRGAGYRSVEAAANTSGCPASRQSIYTYERGEQLPPLPQFLELVEFFVLAAPATGARSPRDLRDQGVAAVVRALSIPAYHVVQAQDLITRLGAELPEE